LRWEPPTLVDLLALGDEDRARAAAELGPVAAGLDVSEHDMTESFLTRLESL